MKNSMQRGKGVLVLLTLVAGVFACAGLAQAELLVYEPFNYAAGAKLNEQVGGGTGFVPSSSWSTANSGVGYVAIKQDGATNDVYITGTTPNPYTNTYQYLPDTGNYMGPSAGLPNGSTAPDHMSAWRALDPSVTATFQNGTRTYFSFTSARATSNARAPSLAIGQGYVTTTTGDRGDTIAAGPKGKQAIAIGGNTAGAGSTANNYPGATVNGAATNVGMVSMYLPQYYDATGTRTLGPAVGAAAFSSVLGTGPQPGDHSYWMAGGGGTTGVGSLLYGYNSATNGDNQSKINIILGEIEWGAGTGGTDLVSYYVFHDKDPLDEATYNINKATWDTLNVTGVNPGDRATWDQISIAGGRYFADEIRVATTFNDALGLAPVPEPGTVALLVTAGLALVGFGWRKRK